MCWTPTGVSLALNPSRVSTSLGAGKNIDIIYTIGYTVNKFGGITHGKHKNCYINRKTII
jgi:hypothetical protein